MTFTFSWDVIAPFAVSSKNEVSQFYVAVCLGSKVVVVMSGRSLSNENQPVNQIC